MSTRTMLWAGLPVWLLAAAASSQALAGWSICNRTPDEMYVAIAYDKGDGVKISQGWWKLRGCGGCKSFGDFKIKGVWYRAENRSGGRLIEGNDLFCVHESNAFKLDTGHSCGLGGKSKSLSRKGFRFVTLSAKNFTSNIEGKSDSGKVCID